MAALKEKLAACGNILSPSYSFYEWHGKTVATRETILILKTTRTRFVKLKKRIIELHPYECPCILRIPIDGVHEDFRTWVFDVVQ